MPSVRAARLIDHLLARQQDPPILEKKTGLPYGWAIWLRSLSPAPRPLHAREVIAVLLPRPLPGPPGRSPQLSTWQAMRRLAWQQWGPAPRDQRWMRWFSASASLLLHLLFAFLLLWVALVRPPATNSGGADGERIQIEFIGQGAQEGGGDQDGEVAATTSAQDTGASAAAASAAGSARPAPAQVAAAAASTPLPSSAAAESSPPVEVADALPPPPAPPLQATEVVEPTSDFVVPPISVPRTEVSVVPRETTPTVREREISTVQAPAVRSPSVTTPLQVRSAPTPTMDVREREIVMPDEVSVTAPAPVAVVQRPMDVPTPREPVVREREVATVSAPVVTAPPLRSREPAVRQRNAQVPSVRERRVADAPVPARDVAAEASSSRSPAPSSSSATATSASQRPGNQASSTTAQAGARPAPTPGNWATPARGDDWGAASRNTEGASQGMAANRDAGRGDGVFNADGSVRVPGQEGAGESARGAPGGDNDGWTADRIAQSGTWLKRPPYDYKPTSFDKYWVPHESLLAEWVRRGVQSIEIPLPGTSTKISCVISVLQFGGGCGLNDPNMQDQPAVARPPPDIPFKKELQEDNGSR